MIDALDEHLNRWQFKGETTGVVIRKLQITNKDLRHGGSKCTTKRAQVDGRIISD
jgi:hypothetical protein